MANIVLLLNVLMCVCFVQFLLPKRSGEIQWDYDTCGGFLSTRIVTAVLFTGLLTGY